MRVPGDRLVARHHPGRRRHAGHGLRRWTSCPPLPKLAGGEVPADRVLDGYDLTPVLLGQGPEPARRRCSSTAARSSSRVRHGPVEGPLHHAARRTADEPEVAHDPPLLYHLGRDPGEQFDVAKEHADVVAGLRKIAAQHAKTLRPVENQLVKRLSRSVRDRSPGRDPRRARPLRAADEPAVPEVGGGGDARGARGHRGGAPPDLHHEAPHRRRDRLRPGQGRDAPRSGIGPSSSPPSTS